MSHVRRHARRHVRRPPDLTSLFDVLFIVVFVALIRAAAAQQTVAALTPPPPKPAPPAPPAPPADVAALRAKALGSLSRELAARTPVVVRIAVKIEEERARGAIAALEVGGKTVPLDVPLSSDSRDPDIEVTYLGDRSTALRICRVAALHLRAADLAQHLVIVAPDRTSAELKRIAGGMLLFEGLKRDVDRCFIEQRGAAVLIDPAEPTKP